MTARILIALLLAFASVGQAVANTTFDTTPDWNGTDSVNPFGTTFTPTYGETFTSPGIPDTYLHSFTFYLSAPTGVAASMEADVFAWSGDRQQSSNGTGHVTGSPLFQTTTNILFTGTGNNFSAVTVPTNIAGNDIQLAAGSDYVVLLTIAHGTGVGTTGAISFGLAFAAGDRGPGNNGDGGFVYSNSNYAGMAAAGGWNGLGYIDKGDLAFQAVFGPAPVATPEPASVVIAGGGLIGLLALAWRRRRHRQPPAAIAS